MDDSDLKEMGSGECELLYYFVILSLIVTVNPTSTPIEHASAGQSPTAIAHANVIFTNVPNIISGPAFYLQHCAAILFNRSLGPFRLLIW